MIGDMQSSKATLEASRFQPLIKKIDPPSPIRMVALSNHIVCISTISVKSIDDLTDTKG
jgi:hypothetical protein